MKKITLVALATVAAIVLGFGVNGATQTAHADTTDVSVVACEFVQPFTTTDPCTDPLTPADITELANAIGDEDGTLEKSDFSSDEINEEWDDNQIADICVDPLAPIVLCTLNVFVFVDDGAPVTIDPTGNRLDIVESVDDSAYTCDTGGAGLGTDDDCSAAIEGAEDGVVVFSLIARPEASPGDVVGVSVRQEDVAQSFDVNIVGPANDIDLTLANDVIQTSGSTANSNACVANTEVTDALDAPNSTLAIAQVTDADDNLLTRIPVFLSAPAGDQPDVIQFGDDTVISLVPSTEGAPIAFYGVICGGSGTGETTIRADIFAGSGPISADDNSTADITVVGAPATLNTTVSPPEIACDGVNSSTVTVTVLDSDGNTVPAGVPVNFSVVALGTANPINTETDADGVASSVVTPLSNASAGVTVIITAGDSSIASPVQTSVRVDCALPIEPTAPVATPTQTGTIGPPDTGSGGYVGQDAGGFSAWTLIVLAIGAAVVATGGLVARRASN